MVSDENLEFENEEKTSPKEVLFDFGLTILALIISTGIAAFISLRFLI